MKVAPAPSKAEVISLGCRLNISESEQIRALLADENNVVVINSCAVTSEAVRQTRQAIRRARRNRPDARLIVTGCAADIEREQLSAMQEVDGLIANTQKLDSRAWNVPASSRPVLAQHTRAFVTVQNGCDHACTFCIIPKGRGSSRSLTISEVLSDVEHHLSQGAAEVVLTGVDVTSWGHDLPGQPSLGQLVHAILERFPELSRLRMSSLDGVEIDTDLFDLFAGEERVMPHLHLSLQSGDDLILKRMKRRHSRKDAVDLVRRLRKYRPDLAIGADIIAGFPTETEDMHAQNKSIITELGIVHGHIFPYSPRPDTPAARMPQVDRAIIKQRAAELRAETQKCRDRWLINLIGTEQQVLAEKDGTGYAPSFARIQLPEGTPAGRILNVKPKKLEKGLLK
ncbi:tRNA (N(6)-L-threonylcarbamoyladenosine(37)-C(2))-methylthiotransferase MtaB [Altericroceibacterium spongiae]|uniref:tRNA (N(6)-L-threonylcarbamoyladenosine(37)-C(2))-methylthiotransferase MtaB n=1 Tax=Altericroceibacterium spongiae TaxID=2320269 RepID=A0A420EN17_9SPHN|nr:tRNA (N(6)-L-threonylcarbamoyladenosine(37)-C(2))-methylthiotransferase MtaB [Altericroceibacterium spongiae]RKF21994.1 tRNA (N(6)-L-threonylcarbamoyladenosine(37)-C(2))-methylthiotransferase MtaB [Altericroceibacterium spongiae]